MRILHLCSAREIGGGEKHLADLATSLTRHGHQVFAAIAPESPVRRELAALPKENIIELPWRNVSGVRSAFSLARFIRARKIEIVHAHLARDYPLAALAAGRSQARLVLTRHVLFPMNRVHRLTLRRTARVIAVSDAVAGSLRSQGIFPAGKIVTIHNGIDVEKFARARTEAAPPDQRHKLRVGMIGHIAPIKGQEGFIRAAAIVMKERAGVEFIIAGEDKSRDGANRARVEQLIRDLGLEQNVTLLGWIEEAAELLATLDLFISPARSEPFGLSIVEAMAAGVPVIATASEGANEILDDNQTGRLVPTGDADALARAIIELLDDVSESSRLATNAQQVARDRFCLARMVELTEQTYRAVIEENSDRK